MVTSDALPHGNIITTHSLRDTTPQRSLLLSCSDIRVDSELLILLSQLMRCSPKLRNSSRDCQSIGLTHSLSSKIELTWGNEAYYKSRYTIILIFTFSFIFTLFSAVCRYTRWPINYERGG
eukprot:sb/3476127/